MPPFGAHCSSPLTVKVVAVAARIMRFVGVASVRFDGASACRQNWIPDSVAEVRLTRSDGESSRRVLTARACACGHDDMYVHCVLGWGSVCSMGWMAARFQ
ncbi:GL25105 [Drosophila persimilis]|uniref:GL25105 n=1 Tax=Drosophila persimilis TaxID=7234 RepID=B4GQV5_DROPE|nr:GL25105 [Drosophila persimilis]